MTDFVSVISQTSFVSMERQRTLTKTFKIWEQNVHQHGVLASFMQDIILLLDLQNCIVLAMHTATHTMHNATSSTRCNTVAKPAIKKNQFHSPACSVSLPAASLKMAHIACRLQVDWVRGVRALGGLFLTMTTFSLNGRLKKDSDDKSVTISSPPVAIFNVGYHSQLAS